MKRFIEEIANKYVDCEVNKEERAWDMLNTCPWFDETEEDY